MQRSRKRKKSKLISLLSGFSLLSFLVFSSLLIYVAFQLLQLPKVSSLSGCITSSLYNVYLCPKSTSYTPLKKVPKHLIDALIISEDSSFFHHNGFDWFELKNSFRQNWERGYFYRGASTISQQLIKNVFLSDEKTILRKVSEAYLTYHLEKEFNKNQILEKYLNVVEFGPNIYGISAASSYYFQKKPEDLSLLESSFLVHLLPNPYSYSRAFAKNQLSAWNQKRMKQILNKMLRFGKIGAQQFHTAIFQIAYFPQAAPENLSPPENTDLGLVPSEEAIEDESPESEMYPEEDKGEDDSNY